MKVAILGANGILGPPTISYLLEYTNVTLNIITEQPEKVQSSERIKTFPRAQTAEAMAGTDVIYNFLGVLATWNDYLPAIAASGAKVYFLPDYGIKHEQRPDFAAMVRKTDHYEQAAKIPGLKCVRLLTGAFADTMIDLPQFWGIDLASKTAASIGDGNTKFSYTFVHKIAETLAQAVTTDLTKLDPILEIKNGDITLREFFQLYSEASGVDLNIVQAMSIEQAEQAIFATQKTDPQGPDYAALYGLTIGTLCNSGYAVISNKDNWIASQKDDQWEELTVDTVKKVLAKQ
ncbi:hypothetical protein CJU90_1063 [Yarrowia sp. C11]|nr:hypothetical protein CKK34_2476 [Yarrowia sp. E02]KAG5373369.1 hypothetical protein CJU90_1063 [Yarrowia sp. C11]